MADEVVMIDIKEGVSEGKAMDMMQTANLLDVNTRIKGVTNDYEATAKQRRGCNHFRYPPANPV